MSQHRPGIDKANLVIRHLKLENPCVEHLEAAINEIDHVYGLDAISYDTKTCVLNLAYNARILSLEKMEAVLSKHGIEISHDWWTHFKEDYYRYVDANVKNNATREPWTCHKK